ncbi:MAG TPA: DMT family transporter [Anaerolineales bacterium]|nr:DMT family transporter [Anaerolineales bacterium]
MLASFFGLISALSWGTGDFIGGVASRKVGAYRTVIFVQIIGLIFILLALPFFNEPFPDSHVIKWSTVAGILGTTGFLAFYEAMRRGPLSIIAPLSALVGAIIPVTVGFFTEGLPSTRVFISFGLAFIAIFLVSYEKSDEEENAEKKTYLPLVVFAGIGFGFYFVLIHEASQSLILSPMIIARTAGTAAVIVFFMFKKENPGINIKKFPILMLSAIFDLGGNVFYILAGQMGRLDMSAVLSSLYPGMTIFWAWLILKERLQFSQWFGIILALTAIVLMTIA